MFIHKVDENIKLRLFYMDDAEELFILTNESRDYLRKWLPWVDHVKEINDSKRFIEDCLKSFVERNGFPKGIAILYNNVIVGTIGFNEVSLENKYVSIGYWLGEMYQSKGIMTKTCKSLINFVFNELNMNRIEIRVSPENIKSKLIPERLGFTNEGKIRKTEFLYDHYVDHYIYGLIKEDW